MRPLTERELSLIRSQDVCRLATVNADGTIHIVPLCPAVVDGAVYVDLVGGKQTGRNLERDPRATALFDEYSSNWEKLWGVQLRCQATFVERGSEEWSRVWAAFEAQYPQHAAFAWKATRLVRLTPRHAISWGTEPPGAR